jgi:hypothetical protein
MDIISSEGSEIMNMKKLLVILSASVIFTASAFTGYFMYQKSKPFLSNQTYTTEANAVSFENTAVISTKTVITKRIRYSKGVPIVIDSVEEASSENLGMDKKTAVAFYKKDGYLVIEFTDKRVTLLKDLPAWPPNYYVVKEADGVINTYYSDQQGKLNFLKASDLDIEAIPVDDQNDLRKGIAFKSLQEIENLFEEYES